MLKTIIAGALVTGLAMPVAAQSRATITRDSIGCPTIDGVAAVYKNAAASKGEDLRSLRQVMATFECEWLHKGLDYTLVSKTPIVSQVIYPRPFRTNKRVYVPTHSISAH